MIAGVEVESFRVVFDRTFPVAERVARRITGDPAVAEELAAEALTRLYVAWSRPGVADHRDAWVLRVTTNLALGVLRKRRRPHPQPPPAPGGEEDRVAVRLALADALRRLPRRQREVVVLRYLTDLSEADVAQRLGLSVGAVKSHLHRGLHSLRDAFDTSDDHDVEARLASD